MSGNGGLPTNAERLTRAIQSVIDEAVEASRDLIDANQEITVLEIRKLVKGVECLRRIVGKQGLMIAQNTKDISTLKADVSEIKTDVAEIKSMILQSLPHDNTATSI